MQLSLIFLSVIFCLINFVITEENADQAKPEITRRPSPFVILSIMPKVIEKLRERFPRQNIDFLFPLLFKEIQETMSLPQLSGIEPSAMPGLIATMVEHMIQRITNFGQFSSPPPSNTESPYDREEGQPKKPEPIAVELNVAKQKLTQDLPDLAFDRDPSRGPPNESPESKIEDDDDDEFGFEPSVPSMLKENISLGEYDEDNSKIESKIN